MNESHIKNIKNSQKYKHLLVSSYELLLRLASQVKDTRIVRHDPSNHRFKRYLIASNKQSLSNLKTDTLIAISILILTVSSTAVAAPSYFQGHYFTRETIVSVALIAICLSWISIFILKSLFTFFRYGVFYISQFQLKSIANGVILVGDRAIYFFDPLFLSRTQSLEYSKILHISLRDDHTLEIKAISDDYAIPDITTDIAKNIAEAFKASRELTQGI